MSTPRAAAETPLMRQYLDTKAKYPDCLLFFRVGDFYELFFDDAVTCAKAIELTLTTRDKGKEDATPMCGVPHHAVRGYLARLIEQGFKVAICDQVEDPRLARGIIKREVTRVVTPGVVLDEEQLDPKAGCFLVALQPGAAGLLGLAYLDVSTAEFGATELPVAAVDDELARLGAREILLPPGLLPELRRRGGTAVTEVGAADLAADGALLAEALASTVDELGLGGLPGAVAAAAACVRYARSTQPTGTLPLSRLAVYQPSQHLVLDEAAQRNLELFVTLSDGRRQGSLFSVLDRSATPMGGRLLRRWLSAPLTQVAQIRRRHDAVEWLVERASLRAQLTGDLGSVYDLERLAGRASLGVATPRDLAALRRSLERLPGIAAALRGAMLEEAGTPEALALPELLSLGDDLAPEVAADVAATLIDEPPPQWSEGGIIRPGCSAELDELRAVADGGKGLILGIEERERQRTGIGSLKVRYNRGFGYFIEITRAKSDRVPSNYIRKQTLVNAERYVTAELADLEARILGADERRVVLEADLFLALRQRVAIAARRLLKLAERVATVDALLAFADVAHGQGYCRPAVDDSAITEILDGRHPVVEQLAPLRGGFVPNDVRLDADEAQLLVVTGPNMAGKSTVMRQVALCALLAQSGSFVPARAARLGIVDRIFTRVGAADQLARGESTFMVEMRETAAILRFATRRSLVVLDEIGRGTSTYDGVSIAWAVAEYLHDRIGCRTMFATHYHELTALARSRRRVRNFQVAVRETQGGIAFLHRLVEGGASRSYGIEVARLAGLPKPALDRARQVLRTLEQSAESGERARDPASPQLALFAEARPAAVAAPLPPRSPVEGEVLEALRALDLDDLSPRAAHQLLGELRGRLGG